jgi:glutamine synthetase
MLKELMKNNKVKYVLVSFSDLRGVMRSKLVPYSAVDHLMKSGAGFAGFATYLGLLPSDPDIVVFPDPRSFTILPWNREVAWVTGDLFMDGKLLPQAPRNILKAVTQKVAAVNMTFCSGVEPEFVLLSKKAHEIADKDDQSQKPCYDQVALMRNYEFVKSVCDSLQFLNWDPYQNDHEDAPGQFEINWKFSDAVQTADRHFFFKYMVKTIAEQFDTKATFMPKPFSNFTGNGCHIHCSMWDLDGKTNLFVDNKGELGLSGLAYHFIGGILEHAKALCALTNPAVNSYKRLNAKGSLSGSTWAPNTVTYGGNNRSHMIRIPDSDRVEFRLPDGAANPYLLQAGVLAAGFLGISESIDPGRRRDDNAYSAGESFKDIQVQLPSGLTEVLFELKKNKKFTSFLGEEFVDRFIQLKQSEEIEYQKQVCGWEIETTVDC